MSAPLAVLLLPAANAGPDALDATRASVRAEAGADVPLLELAAAAPADALAAGELIAFARAGDRWRPGTLEPRARTLRAHPTAALSIAGHVRTDADGREVVAVPAPRPPLDPVELLVRTAVEPAAVLVRAAALDAEALALLARPHGDAVVWSRLVRARGFVPSGELAASVPLDPDRHGHAPQARLAALIETVAEAGEAPGGATVRRELLRRLYVEPDPAAGDVVLTELLGLAGDARAAAIVDDLQWTLERQRDALAAERVRWAAGEVAPEESLGALPDGELLELRGLTATIGGEIALRDAMVRRLEAEVYRRDAIIASLTATPLGTPAEEPA